MVPLQVFPILAILTLCEIKFSFEIFSKSYFRGSKYYIWPKNNRKKENLSRRFRPVEVVVIGYPLDTHRILEKFPLSGIQNFLFIMFQIYKIKFQNFK